MKEKPGEERKGIEQKRNWFLFYDSSLMIVFVSILELDSPELEIKKYYSEFLNLKYLAVNL